MSCAKCFDIFSFSEEIIQCAKASCSNYYHLDCLEKTVDIFVLPNFFWFCDDCVPILRINTIRNNIKTNTNQKCTKTYTEEFSSDNLLLNQIENSSNPNEISLESDFDANLAGVSDNSGQVSQTVSKLCDTVKDLSAIIFSLGNQISSLSVENSYIGSRLDSLETHSRRLNVEITGIPFRKGEDLRDIFDRINSLIGIPCSLDNLTSLFRIKPFDNHQHRKSIIVAFKDRFVRDSFLRNSKACREFTLQNLGIESTIPDYKFFVNEHLSTFKKELLFQVKQNKHLLQYQRFWVSRGNIYLKLVDGQTLNVSNRTVLNNLLRP